MNYGKIKNELERRGITIKDFCRRVDITEQGLHQMIRNESMKIDVLERISDELDLPVSYWFDTFETDIDGVAATTATAETKHEEPVAASRRKISHAQQIDRITSELNAFLKSLVEKK